ncbi:MAG: hypothetical protein U0Q07_11855 [Acidimicrobiales bacterium]
MLLPEDEGVERWRWEQRASRAVAAIALVLAVLVVVVAVLNLRSEGALTHAEAIAVADRDGGRTLVEWEDGTTRQAVYESQDHGLAVGDTIEVVYPPGHPSRSAPPTVRRS